MPSEDREAPMDALGRYWNDLVGDDVPPGDPAPDLDPALAETVRRLQALGTAPAPATARDRVWRGLEAHLGPMATVPLNGRVVGANHAPVSPPLAAGEPDPERRSPVNARRWWPYLEFAAMILLVVSLLGGYLYGSHILPWLVDLRRDPAPASVPFFRGGPARTGEQPGPGPDGSPVVRWRLATGAYPPAAASVADGIVYAGDLDGTLHAADLATGQERWTYVTGGPIGAAPAVADGVVYIGDQTGTLHALDAATGVPRWTARLGGGLFASSPAVVDGVVYVAGSRQTGASAPTIVDGVVYAGGDGSASRDPITLYAVDAAAGTPVWSRSTTRHGLYAFDAGTGAEQWFFPTRGYVHASAAVADGVVYVGANDGTISAIDTATGTARWTFQTGKPVTSPPAVVGGLVYVGGGDGRFFALDAATGAARWTADAGAIARSAPAVADGAVYVVAAGALVAMDASTGDGWRLPLGTGSTSSTTVDSSPAVVDGLVIAAGLAEDGTGALVAFGDPEGGTSLPGAGPIVPVFATPAP